MNNDGGNMQYHPILNNEPSPPPQEFICPILNTIMMDPVLATETGLSYENSVVVRMKILDNDICPVTRRRFGTIVPNHCLQERIIIWLQQRRNQLSQNRRYRRRHRRRRQKQQQQTPKSISVDTDEDTKTQEMDDTVVKCIQVHTRHKVETYAKSLYRDLASVDNCKRKCVHHQQQQHSSSL